MEPPSSILDDYFSLGIAFILILFSYALTKGCELAYFSLSSKDAEDIKTKDGTGAKRVIKHLSNSNNISWTVLQTKTLLQISLLFLLIEIVYRIFNPESYLFLVAVAILLVTALLLKLTESALFKYFSVEGRNKVFAMKISGFFSFLMFLAKPFISILSKFTIVLTESKEERDAQSIEEVEEKPMLQKIVGLSNTSVFQIMKPRMEIVSLDMEMNSAEVIRKAIECGFSRLPVYENSPDNIKGFLYIKDLVSYLRKNVSNFDWHKHIREAYFVPGSKKIDDLLEEFRQKKMHLALVVDEYGGTDGIVTLEDILEEIVGEISDETDKT